MGDLRNFPDIADIQRRVAQRFNMDQFVNRK